MKTLVKVVVAFIILVSSAIAASPAEIDKLTTYAVILGRATACGINTKEASSRVGTWMDRTFPPASAD